MKQNSNHQLLKVNELFDSILIFHNKRYDVLEMWRSGFSAYKNVAYVL